jgi:transcriptional regulator with XRE-family HTH domain
MRMSRRELAARVNVDPSNVSLWLRGHIPRRAIVQRVGTLFGDLPGAFAAAGYQLSHTQADAWWRAQLRGLSESSLALLNCLSLMPYQQQDELTKQLRAYLTRAHSRPA